MVRRLTVVCLALAVAGLALVVPQRDSQADELAGPTADQLRIRASCESQLSNGKYAPDEDGSASVAVCKSGDAVHWTADLDIDCDGQRTTQCSEDTDPSFQPDTSFHQSDGQPLNSAGLPFIVVPLPSSIWKYGSAGIAGGTVAAVVYQDKVAYAVVGDEGPTGIIGEGSYKLAQQLGIDPDPASGGVDGAVVTYILFPGVTAAPIESAADAVSKGETAANAFVNGATGQ
ncbi:glycoside hydrolase family 75 protein [Kribbella sp. NPDC054772]